MPHVYSVLANANNNSGVYNLCSSEAIILKDLLLLIASLMGKSPELYNFGGLPYRHNQPMVINGSNAKYIKTFNAKNKIFADIEMGIENIIQNHKTRTK